MTRRLARWYRRERRDLPWRRTRDPYAIWLSEVMTQQTTVGVVAPRWKRFRRALSRRRRARAGVRARGPRRVERPRLLRARPEPPPRGEGRRGRGRVPAHARRLARAPGTSARTRPRPSRRSPRRARNPSSTETSCASCAGSTASLSTRRRPRRRRGCARSRGPSSRRGIPASTTRPSWSSAPSSARPARRAAAPARSARSAAPRRAERRRRSRERRGAPARGRSISSARSSRGGRGREKEKRFFWWKTGRSCRGTSSCPCFACPPGNALKVFLEGGGSGSRAARPERSSGWRRSAIPCSNGATSSPSSPSKKIFFFFPRSPSPRRQPDKRGAAADLSLRPADLSRHAHGGLLLKVLAAWRAHVAPRAPRGAA